MIRLTACVLGLSLFAACPALAEPTGETTDESLKAIETARTAVSEALSKAPLGFRRILFVKEVPEGFAAYKPRDNTSFAPNEPLIIYTEPIGVAWKQDGDQFSSKLVVDFEIRTPDGKVLAGQKSFGEFALEAREPPLDYMSHIKLDVTGAPAGSYVLGLTIHDTNSGKTASKDLPFDIK
ncbi:MAG TPA: hypothetical protein VHK26_01420 [Methyloceanibacter sp.]|nr:hypothetical protein [Methyloceanibacter sp.]